MRSAAKGARLAFVRMEPEAPDDPALRDMLGALGWVPATHVQPDRSRIIDLVQDEAALLAGMHRKCRQSIAKSERLGVRVVEADGARLDDFYAIHTDAMRRAGIAPRTIGTYRGMWQELAPRGMARLLFAEVAATGEPIATLFLVGCGTQYDLWGRPREGIERFKTGFGGQEVDYIGAWDLVTDPLGRRVLRAGERARSAWRRWRYRDTHRPDAPDEEPGGD
jgi:lipid II:glycine glycyltransferase (peptidoglycan interpeptide bridge formation enzyme)